MPDIAIPIVFPDYLIAVDTPKARIKIPDLIPNFDILPSGVEIPATKNKVPELGHAGILFINAQLGTTKYYEYGRYGGSIGSINKLGIRDVKILSDGHPSKSTLTYVLSQISAKSGQGGRILGAYIVVPGKYQAMLEYAQKRMQDNTNPARQKYGLFSNSCNHFMKGILEAADVDTPYMFDPRPNSYIGELRSSFPRLDYSRAENKLVVEDAPASLAATVQVISQPAAA